MLRALEAASAHAPAPQRPPASSAQPIAGSARAWARRSRAVDEAFRDYRFDFAASALYEFTWYEFCDWYLEIVKPVLRRRRMHAAQRAALARTLLTVLETLLRTLHPLMPFITEEIWLRVAPLAGVAGDSIMLAPWPRAAISRATRHAEAELRWVSSWCWASARFAARWTSRPSRRLPLLLQHAGERDLALPATPSRAARAPGGSRSAARARTPASRRRRPPPRWSAS